MSVARNIVPLDFIEVTPDVCGGRPRIAGTRIKVSLIAQLHVHAGQAVDDIVVAYPHLSLAQVHAALAYYYDHHDEIEEEIRASDASVDEMMRKDPSSVLGT